LGLFTTSGVLFFVFSNDALLGESMFFFVMTHLIFNGNEGEGEKIRKKTMKKR
jgi:hypothetical protein